MIKFYDRMKLRLGITSNRQFWIIMLVFSLTGFSFLFVKKPIYALAGITPETPFWLRTILWILLVFPCYYVFLLIYGFIFGQFDFFWNMVKKTVGRFSGRLK